MNFPITNALLTTTKFGMGPAEFGLLGSIMAVGTMAGALLAARRTRSRLRFLLRGALGLGFFTLLGSISPSFWLYAAVLIPVGLAWMTFLNSCNTSIQLTVEPQFRGRILALYLAVLQGGMALGAPLMGWTGTEFGARWSIALCGGIVLAAGLFSMIIVGKNSPLSLREQCRNAFCRKPGRAEKLSPTTKGEGI